MTDLTAEELEFYVASLLEDWGPPRHPKKDTILAWPIEKRQVAYNHFVRIKLHIVASQDEIQANRSRRELEDLKRSKKQ
jgi:hypothetical protein